MTKDEVNRRLAEWVGTSMRECYQGETHVYIGKCIYCDNCGLRKDAVWPDFYLSEEANAMLLEKMPEPLLWDEYTADERQRNGGHLWGCDPDGESNLTQFDKDRKTAIVNAALALIESEETK